MKLRILNIITCLFIVIFTATSCLDSDEEIREFNPNASIISFSINNIETKYKATVNGKDTTLIATVYGSNYPFIIDQAQGLIYNVDSLPYGTNVSKVVVNINADGYVFIAAETDSIWEETDSLNYENPIQFKVMAYDGSFGRTYTSKVNVHKQDPEKMTWNKYQSNFSTEIQEQKAVFYKNQIFVFAKQENQIAVTTAYASNGNVWEPLQTIDIPEKADYSSVIVWGDFLYILAESQLYQSDNGIHWTKVQTEQKLNSLIAGIHSDTDKKLIGVTIDNLYTESVDGSNWTSFAPIPSTFPTNSYYYATYPLKTNENINRIVVMGQNQLVADTTNVIWSQLASEHEWFPLTMEDNPNSCPNLRNASMIFYNDQLYVFGGPGKNGGSAKAFDYFYSSKDNGIGWEKVIKGATFPEEFNNLYAQSSGCYSCTIDNENYLWIMWGKTGDVWRGRINKLGFINQ